MSLSEINERLKRTSIKGREYVEVNQRILGFWELHPDGRIVTEKTFDDGKRCDFRAEVWSGDRLMATGHAFEFQSAGMVNKTSYVENCETSAVGRALGMLGIGITDSIASADEVMSAMGHQERGESPQLPQPAPSPTDAARARLWAAMKDYAAKHGRPPEEVLAELKANREWEARHDDPGWLGEWAAKFEKWAAADG